MQCYRTDTIKDETINVRQHAARKNYECIYCRKEIEKGEVYTKAVGVSEGYFMSVKYHNQCYQERMAYIKDCLRKQ